MNRTRAARRVAGLSSWLLFVMLAGLLLSLWPVPPRPAAAAPVPAYTLTLSATSGGSVQASPAGPTYPAGTVVTLTATANAGFVFTGWLENGVLQSWASPWTIRMDADRTVGVSFVPRPAFTDLPSDPRYAEAITQLAARGVIKGHQDAQTCRENGLAAPCFLPNDSIVRAEESALIVRAMGWSSVNSTAAPFSDIGMVDPELQRAIAILFGKHIIVGYGNRLFGPLDDVLHIQAVSFITRAMVQKGYWQAATQDDPTIYPNVPASSGARLDLVTFVQNAGPIIDRPAHQNWDDWNTPGTRAWCAELVWQALNAFFGGNHPPFNTAPVANNDSYTTAEDTPLTVDAAHGVLANDTDAEHDILRAVLVTSTTHGALALNADGSFVYTPDLHFNGPDSFTYKANDGQLDSNVATVAITVSHVNQAPSFTKGADQTVLENAGPQTVPGWATNISAGPPDEAGQTLTFIVTNNTNTALFSAGPAIDPATGNLTYTPATNANGTATITIVLKDNGGTANGGNDTSPSQAFVISVTPVNQTPTFTGGPNQTVLANAGKQTVVNWATNISPGAANESGQTLTFIVTNNTNAALFSAGPAVDGVTGNLAYTPSGTSGTASITIVLKDNGGTANGGNDTSAPYTFTITVASLPAVSSTMPANGAKNVALNATVTVVFNQAVTVSGNWFQIACGTSGTRTPANSAVNTSDNTTYVITPNAPFSDGENCTLTVFAADVTGPIGGAHPASDYTATFTPNVPPTVTGTTPANNATSVPVTSAITVTFSEPVNVTASAFTLECPAGTAKGFTVAPAPPGGASTFTLTPSANLPGGVICTVTVVAAQVHDVDVNSAMTSNYTFSFTTLPPPVAADDTYSQTVLGNMPVDSSKISFNVLTNDTLNGGAITTYDTTSAHGGTVVMTTTGPNAGQFTYNPPAGYQGADTFTYMLTNSSGSAIGTVHLTISGMIWFINKAAPSGGDGSFNKPFNDVVLFNAINNPGTNHPAAGDTIFVYENTTNYSGPLTLLTGQKLIGQDATSGLSTLSGLTPPSSSPPFPLMNSVDATYATITGGLTLGTNNLIAGFTLGNANGVAALTGTGFGTLMVSDVVINNTVNAGLALSTGAFAPNAAFISITTTGGTNGINLASVSGSVNLGSGALSGSSGPAFLVNNSSATITYGGTVSGPGIALTNNTGGTITFTGTLTLNSGVSTAFNATGGGTVTATGTGSTLTATTGTALNVQNTTIGASGLTFQSISASGGSHGIVLNNTGTVGGLTVTGTGGAGSGGTIQNTTSPGVSLTSAGTVSLSWLTVQNSGSLVNGLVANNVTKLTIANCAFNNNGQGVQVYTSGSGSGDVSIQNSTFTNNAYGLSITHDTSGTLTFNVSNSTINGNSTSGSAIKIDLTTNATGTLSGTLFKNTVNNAQSAVGPGIFVQSSGKAGSVLTVKLDSNNVSNVGNYGISAVAGQGGSTLNATVTNNTVVITDTLNGLAGIDVESGTATGDTTKVCAALTGNNSTSAAAGYGGIYLYQQTPLFIQGLSPSPATTSQTTAYLQSQNGTTTVSANPTTATYNASAGNCPQPTTAAPAVVARAGGTAPDGSIAGAPMWWPVAARLEWTW